MVVLGIETSCDETAVAVLADGVLRSNVVQSQDAIHRSYGGVVPELASRRHLEVVLPVLSHALGDAGVGLADLDGIAVTCGPGLVGSLLVGLSVAKGLAYACRVPLVGVNHLEGHIFAGFLEEPRASYPFVALVVSGGHTALYACPEPLSYRLIGQTRDDAAGEAFDKVAKILGLGYPGGPVVERTAREGNARAIPFPMAQITDGAPDFSFSGLKTAVSLYVRRHGPPSPRQIADICASFQATVVKMLVRKTVRAASRLGIRRILLTGGVAANRALREALEGECAERGYAWSAPPLRFCTDNAAMIAAAGAARLARGERANLTLNARAVLPLA
ncbi:MAG: tRNA (adenosine(37)-N6)-threonylcarbamoyltransferase complex transferase subunit TsaD [Candidatus Rokubacteria bacterium]|nr:tRNA (adenosine(37)-N6)-threonylcarbamoyltransferase complex transferase subunit TsaD [Candidatus Rokubacteria bacterium]